MKNVANLGGHSILRRRGGNRQIHTSRIGRMHATRVYHKTWKQRDRGQDSFSLERNLQRDQGIGGEPDTESKTTGGVGKPENRSHVVYWKNGRGCGNL